MRRAIHLLVIDPQNDFCDLPAAALPVAGANTDMLRVAQLIGEGGPGLSAISVTLDSHQRIDIAHPPFWVVEGGADVMPFTQISAADVRAGRYLPRDRSALARTLAYLDQLEAAGRYTLMVWPVHCEIGTWGHQVHAGVAAALQQWEAAGYGKVNEVVKGTNPWTEHYSAIQAEVPDADDAGTQLNAELIALLARADIVYIVGEAGSHCVRATTEHLVEHFEDNKVGQLVLVTDCMSPVAGFAQQQQQFIDAMVVRGLRIATAATVLEQLQHNGRS